MVESGAFSLAASATRDISSVLTNTFKSAWEVKKQTSSTPAMIESAERTGGFTSSDESPKKDYHYSKRTRGWALTDHWGAIGNALTKARIKF